MHTNLRFIDSVNFLLTSRESLVRRSDSNSFKMTEKRHKDEETRMPLLKKAIFPHVYVNSFERFSEAKLPAMRRFTPS